MSPNIFGGVAALVAALSLTLISTPGSPPAGAELIARRETPVRLPDTGLELRLNIPAFRLDVYEAGERTSSYEVAVGTPQFRTPIREFTISQIVWNPWWYPPPSEWARDEKPAPPGPANPMGRVKLQASQYIYIHGTPAENSIGTAGSHGCIRMRNADAIELARLVHAYASDSVTAFELDLLEANRTRTTTIELDRPVTFRSEYHLVEVIDETLLLYPDVYGRAPAEPLGEVRRVLQEAGVDPWLLPEAQLADLWKRSRREKLEVPIEVLTGVTTRN